MATVTVTTPPLTALRALTLPTGEKWGAAFQRDPWIEREVLGPILARNDDGTPRYRLVWIELARGHYKTGLAAGVAAVAALTEYGTNVFPMASDADQARLILEALEGQCFRNPKLAARLRQTRDVHTAKATNSRIRILAADAPSGFGLGADARRLVLIADELTQWRDRAMWDMAMTTLPKVRDAQLIVITNAGVRGTWQEEARKAVEREAAAGRAYLFAVEGVLASWLRPEDLELTRATTPPGVYQRYYENRWVDAEEAFLAREDLARCIEADLEPQLAGVAGVQYFVGLDLGLTKDQTARAVVHLDAEANRVVLDDLRVWQGSREDPVLIADVEDDMVRVEWAFGHPRFKLDPWQMASTLQRFKGALDVSAYDFNGPSVQHLSTTLYGLAHNGLLALYPDAELERELLSLQTKQTSYGYRIDHRAGGHDDRAMALGMAALACLTEQPEEWEYVELGEEFRSRKANAWDTFGPFGELAGWRG